MAHSFSLVRGVLILMLGLSAGQVADSAEDSDKLVGDPERGANKIATCLACHGQDGNSQSAALGPKLAGQHEGYLARQMKLFQSGGRENAIMAPMAAGLSAQDMADLGAYYAAQTVQTGIADDQLVALGEQIYRVGNPPTGVPACQACHGPSGLGNPLAGYPALAGQHTQYTLTSLQGFHQGVVWGQGDEANAVMAGVARNLTEEQMQAVASYIEGLHTK